MNLRITAFDGPAACGPGEPRRGGRGHDLGGGPAAPIRRAAGALGGPAGRMPPPPRMHRKQTR
ncbi:hypothetical protein [Streptomyces sp. NPDC004134]|uniref:hypothetical protein n=1 Tax=Streptomyces sp. NPDC004134 TaxID=3364691 RepID=UPI003692DA9E